MSGASNRSNGFTLIEVLVALAMASLLAGMLFEGASLARRRAAAAQAAREGLFIAQNILAEGVTQPFDREARSGMTNGFAWTLDQIVLTADPRGRFGLVQLEARVSRNARPVAALRTRKLKMLDRS